MDFWLDAKSWDGAILNDNLPLALIRQADDSFVPLKVGELRAAGVPDFMFWTVNYVNRGTLLPAALSSDYVNLNQVRINTQEITFH